MVRTLYSNLYRGLQVCIGKDRIRVSGTHCGKRMNNRKDRGSGEVCAATDKETLEAVPWPNQLLLRDYASHSFHLTEATRKTMPDTVICTADMLTEFLLKRSLFSPLSYPTSPH